MNVPDKAAANQAATAALERPDAQGEVIRYFRIDFHRCRILRGTRAKPAEKRPPLIETR